MSSSSESKNYICEPCGFNTEIKGNFARHQTSKAHQAKCPCTTPTQPTIDQYFSKIEKKIEEHAQVASLQITAVAEQVAELKSRFQVCEEVAILKAQLLQKDHEIDILKLKLEHSKELADVRVQAAGSTRAIPKAVDFEEKKISRFDLGYVLILILLSSLLFLK